MGTLGCKVQVLVCVGFDVGSNQTKHLIDSDFNQVQLFLGSAAIEDESVVLFHLDDED